MASKHSDRELLLRALFTKEPYQQSRLVFDIKPDVRLMDVVNFYSAASWPSEKIRCAVCHAARHRDGLTVLLSDGTRALMGSTCGERQFGISFRHARERLDLERDRQFELRMLGRFRLVAKDLVAAVRKWERPVGLLEARRRTFSSHFTSLYGALQSAHLRDGDMLMESVKVRKHNARSDEDLFTYQRQAYARLDGGKLFDAIDVEATLSGAAGTVDTYAGIALADGTEQWKTTRLSTARKKFEGAASRLSEVQDVFEAADAFFQPENLRAVYKWAYKEMPAVRFEVQGRNLMSPSGARIGLDGIPDLNASVSDLIAEWRRAE